MLDSGSDTGSGSGESLPRWVLTASTLAALLATGLSVWTIILQLKNYRKPLLRRSTVSRLVPYVMLTRLLQSDGSSGFFVWSLSILWPP
jgi:hypothetical protein